MVFFVCEGCNETLKKNKVDQHANRCRNCWAVSCVDCSKCFEGDDYRSHTSCISEAEKYEKSLYRGGKASSGASKGKLKPQEIWMDVVASFNSPESDVQNVLERIRSYDNVPRKQKKFVNFISNSLNLRNSEVVEKAFQSLDSAFRAASKPEEPVPTAAIEKSEVTKSNTPPTPTEDSKSQQREEKSDSVIQLNWSRALRKLLKKTDKKQLPKKELRKKVIQSFMERYPGKFSKDELKKQFKNHLKQSSVIVVKGSDVQYEKGV